MVNQSAIRKLAVRVILGIWAAGTLISAVLAFAPISPATATSAPSTSCGGCSQNWTRVSIPSDVLFATNSATLGPNSQSALENVAHIAAQSRGPVCVVGYTDDTGSAAYNQALSIRRARAVVIGLVVLGVNSDRLGAEGEGEANPVASNVSGSGRAQNRRVEVLFTSCSTNG